MGACYTVQAKLVHKNNDPKPFCDAVHKMANDLNLKSKGHPVEEVFNLDDPFECFKMLTTKDAYIQDDGTYSADFDAMYLWESVLHDVFYEAAKVLDNGSEIFISPDDYWYTFTMVNGDLVVTDSPDDEEFDD